MKTINKLLIVVIFTLCVLIGLKKSKTFNKLFHEYVYNANISFMSINTWYENIFGTSIPFKDFLSAEPVFSEELVYSEKKEYLDGLELIVTDEYLVPALDNGLVLFIGEKEGYGNVVIIENGDGIDIWYGNINSNVKLYDYVSKGELIGSTNGDKLYVVYEKNGTILNYEDHF